MSGPAKFKLTRVGAGPGSAVFECAQLLGDTIEVIDADDYDEMRGRCADLERQVSALYVERDKYRFEALTLHAEISMAKSPEVCAAAHENVEECGYCQRDAAMESLANQQNATQLALARIEELERDQKLLLTLRDSYEMASNPPGGAEKCFKCATLETFILWMIERMKSLEDAQ